MKTIYSNSDVNNDVFCRQEDKECYQVKRWPPTQQLVIKSIVLNFGPIKGGICHAFRHLAFQIKIMFLLSLSLYIFVMFKLCLY